MGTIVTTEKPEYGIASYRSEVKRFTTLVDALRYRSGRQSGETALFYLEEDGEGYRKTPVTYERLDTESRKIASLLQSMNSPGSRALLIYPPGIDYIAAFFGCLYAGVMAVPIYPPNLSRIDLSLQRLDAIIDNAQPVIVLTNSQLHPMVSPIFTEKRAHAGMPCIATDSIDHGAADQWREPKITPEHTAFLQYTSGSTGTPRGVMVSHENILNNLHALSRAFGMSPDYTGGVSWLPQYHDMGLIGGILLPLWSGHTVTLMSPLTFLYNPGVWLREISDTRASVSGGPNFAYDHACRRVTEAQKEGLDLSCWHVALNGAEPVRADTMERFYQAFRECGFRREAFMPGYGLAEATLLVSSGPVGKAPVICCIDGDELKRKNAVVTDTIENAKQIIGCGNPIPGHAVRIVDPGTLTPCGNGRIGEIWVAGPCVAGGYWNSPAATSRTFQAHLQKDDGRTYLRTGDLGFILNDELFITGRIKELLIIRGKNYYPQDIEQTVQECSPSMRKGCGAAFSVMHGDAEHLVIVQEVKRKYQESLDTQELFQVLRKAVNNYHDITPAAIVLLKEGQVFKTSSGKLQRFACRDAFCGGHFDEIARWGKNDFQTMHKDSI